MATYEWDELFSLWAQGKLTEDMFLGQIAHHLKNQEAQIKTLERELNKLKRQVNELSAKL